MPLSDENVQHRKRGTEDHMTRIVFVDDEPRILDGLRLGLRGKRRVWDMVFHECGRAALADVEKSPVDVVVSDMRMPRMDGAQLLAKVAVLRPQAARVILSGQMDESAAVRAASVAHRFLAKPCDAKALEGVISQTLELNGWLKSDDLKKRIGGVEALPCIPRIYSELNRALANPETSMSNVARIIEGDPGMAAKVLQLVNSSFFGLPRRMVSVAQAVSYLGTSTMKNLTLANSLFHDLGSTDVRAAEYERERSLLRARIARRFFTSAASADPASTAALLLHVGTLVLQSRMPREHAAACAEATAKGAALHEIERERLGVTHAEVGAYLLGMWGLPHEIVEAVATQHAPMADGMPLDVANAVRVADALTCKFLPSPGDAAHELPPACLEQLGISGVVAEIEAELRGNTQGSA